MDLNNYNPDSYVEEEVSSVSLEGEADTTSSASDSGGTSDEQDSKKRHYDKVQAKISLELRIWVIKAVLAIMKRYNQYNRGMNEEHTQKEFEYYLDQTPYSPLLEDGKNNKSTSSGLILRAVSSCQFMSYRSMGDEMHSNLFGRDLCGFEHGCQVDADGKPPELIDFQAVVGTSIGSFTQTHLDYLKELHPDVKQEGRLVKRSCSDVILIACRIKGKFNVHLCSAGSKFKIMKMFHWENIKSWGTGERILVDLFSRSASVVWRSMAFFDRVYCGDKDKQFSNFFEVLRDYPIALCLRVKCVLTYHEVLTMKAVNVDVDKIFVGDCDISLDKAEQLFDKLKKDLKSAFANNKSPDKSIDKIIAAANLLIMLNFSHYGYIENFDTSCADRFLKTLNTVFADLIYTSSVLQDSVTKESYIRRCNGLSYITLDTYEKNRKKNKKNKPAKANTFVCPVSYVYWDFSKGLNKFKNNENAVITIDMPYLLQCLFPCGDYSDSFGLQELRRLLKPFRKGCKCKAVLFHSGVLDIRSVVIEAGFRKVGIHTGNGYTTEIYSYNISPDEKFFIPDDNKN